MPYFVSRQSYWGVDPEDQNVVEIAAGGIDYANPDMLVSKYPGEGQTYDDPREAVTAAIVIAKAWKKDQPKLKIGIAHGFTGGYTMPFEKGSLKDLRKWAAQAYEALPKCDGCGGLMGKEKWHSTEDPDLGNFCSERCAERAMEAVHEVSE